MAGTPYLIDTNVLLRWIKPDDRDYPITVALDPKRDSFPYIGDDMAFRESSFRFEAKDHDFAANSRSFASLRMTIVFTRSFASLRMTILFTMTEFGAAWAASRAINDSAADQLPYPHTRRHCPVLSQSHT
jgi:hypothetical protein